MTTLQFQIPDQKAASLEAYVRARGLTLDEWFLQVAEQATPDQPAETSAPDQIDERPIWEIFADAMKDVPREELAALPTDGAEQIDHYLYGHPKR